MVDRKAETHSYIIQSNKKLNQQCSVTTNCTVIALQGFYMIALFHTVLLIPTSVILLSNLIKEILKVSLLSSDGAFEMTLVKRPGSQSLF